MITFEEHILIESYLNGEMTGEERRFFEKRIEESAELRENLETYKITNDIVTDFVLLDIRDQLQQIDSRNRRNGFRNLWILVGLLVAVLAGFILVTWSSDEPSNHYIPRDSKNLNNKEKGVESVHPVHTIKVEETEVLESNDVLEKKPQDLMTYRRMFLEQVDTLRKPDLSMNYVRELLLFGTMVVDTLDQFGGLNCDDIVAVELQYRLDKPCLDDSEGELIITHGNIQQFSIDGGKTFASNSRFNLSVGNYTLIGKNANGCETIPQVVVMNYDGCNYVVQPSMHKFLEIKIPQNLSYPLVMEIRNARTAVLNYEERINGPSVFNWNGNNNAGVMVTGNHVYILKDRDGKVVVTGQITVVG